MSLFVTLAEVREAAETVYGGIPSVPSGWQIDSTFGDGGERQGPSGGYVYALKPLGVDDGRRMLVFRGTEVTLTNMKDLFADVTDIGKTQFSELDEFVNPWLAQQLVDGNRVELVGHSSGGALVQWAINDRNVREENSDNDQTLISVLEAAKQLDEDFVLDPSQLHFTTFNAPGITHVLGGSTPTTDRTSVVVGDHHVVIGYPPLLQGDVVHLLGGPHVGGAGTQVIGHQVEFADFRDGLFAHTIEKPEYWTAPVVAYTPQQLDLALAQSFARHYAQLGNTDGTVEGNVEALFRLTLYVSSLGVAFGVGEFGKQAEAATQLVGLQFDRDVFANTLALPSVGINQALGMITRAAEAAGRDVVLFQELVSSSLIAVGEAVVGAVAAVESFASDTLVPWITDMAYGISNAVSEFLQDIPSTLFDLGRTLNFTDLNPFTSAYAHLLNDPGLDSTLRAAVEDALAIVQRAGQAVVIQNGMGPNPFDTPGFDPAAAPPATVMITEGQWQTLSIYLPFTAGAGGQPLTLSLSGANASAFVLRTTEGELTQQNGGFSVVVPEGIRQLTVQLWATEPVSSASSLTLSAQLTTAEGEVTHNPGVEASLALADVGSLPDGSLPVIDYVNGQQSVTYVGDNDNNEPVFTAAANHIVFGNEGFDVLDLSQSAALYNHQIFGGIGNDALFGGEGKDRLSGEEGFDFLTGGGGPDVLSGGDTADRLQGDSSDPLLVNSVPGNDYLDGGLGDDLVEGLAGDDTLYGGLGNDFLLGDDNLVYVNRPVGRDYLDGGDGNDSLFGGRGDDQLFGGAGDDLLRGDNKTNSDPDLLFTRVPGSVVVSPTTANAFFGGDGGADYLDGGGENDKLLGDGGDDLLLGGEGNDQLYGDEEVALTSGINAGNDWLEGGAGDDQLQGDEGEDVLFGGDGNDFLQGDYVNETGFADYLDGGAGNDGLAGVGGDDVLIGGDGQDLLQGGDGDDALDGGTDNDVLFGELGDDVLDGGDGDDQLVGDVGNDELAGGRGSDFLSGGDGDDVLDGQDDADTLQGDSGDDFLVGGAGNDLLIGGEGIDAVVGKTGDDELQGNLGNDVLYGSEGADRLFGQEDDDRLFGDEGNDTMWGGLGHDVLEGGTGDDALVGDDTDLVGGSGGADVLEGGRGNDYLGGSGGRDIYLFNLGDGYDVIRDFAGEGNRIVFGPGISQNSIVAAAGPNDSLIVRTGGSGDVVEILNFGAANQNGSSHPIDTFEFSEGTILTYDQLAAGGLGISGGAGNDQVVGTTEGERIFGGAGNDTVQGLEGADTLLGEAGADRLEGGAGDDRLLGGRGNDALFGGAGQDTYIFASGDGIDQIQDTPGEGNRLVFGSGISLVALSLGLKQVVIPGSSDEEDPGTTINYLVLRTGVTGDAVEIEGFDPANQSTPLAVEQFSFADGTLLTAAQLVARGLDLIGTTGIDTLDGQEIYRNVFGLGGNDFLIGGPIDNILDGGDGNDVLLSNGGADQLSGGIGDDVMRGGDGDDVLDGGAGHDSLEGEVGVDVLAGGTGDDQLLGGVGDDRYRFNLGDGRDALFDAGPSTETDTVVFGDGITSSSVSLSPQFGQIVIRVGAGSDGIQSGSISDVFGSQTIEQFQFADGTILVYADLVARGFTIDGTDFDDVLVGTNLPDRFRGGLGNDRLEGGEGNDSYIFNLDDGGDTIVDTPATGAENEVVFGSGITSADVYLDLAPDQSDPSRSDLLLRVGTNGDAIRFDTFDRNNVFGPCTVETFRFDDGSTLTYDQLLARGFDLTGTDGNDQIAGTNVVDRIVAGAGADVLRSGLGDDTLDGGAGNDRLSGWRGNDTYVFGYGSGQDAIAEFEGSLDVIRMTSSVAPSDVAVMRQINDIVLSLSGGADRLTVQNHFVAPQLQIEQVVFADGTVWDQAFIENLVNQSIAGTGGNDALIGTGGDDRLLGFGGDDQLIGLAGHDRLDGGSGVDQLAGGTGDDLYVVDDGGDVVTEIADEGVDTVQSNITSTLEANVENLTLTGATAINGIGNDLDNVLTGNDAANVLTGGHGDDTYVVGAGDTIVELAGEGTDTVESSVNTSLGANLEHLNLTGSASLVGAGNSLDNVLQADGSISLLAGGDGNDTYLQLGPNGDDDVLIEIPTGGIDRVIAAHAYRLPANIENLTLLDPLVPDFESFSLIPYGSIGITVTGYGNDLSNTIVGGRTANVLDGGIGADTLIGGAGDDTYVVDHVNDVVIEQANDGTDIVLSPVSYQLSADVEYLTLTGSASIDGTGNALTNEMRGNNAANVLDGGGGDDSLQGLGGADIYLFGPGSGRDIVLDSSTSGEIETVQLAPEVTPADIEVYRRDFGIVLVIRGTADELTLASFFDQAEYAQKQVRFADGTLWNEAELRTRAMTVGGTVAGMVEEDTLSAGPDRDVMIGSAGDDVLNASFPVTLAGLAGDDTYLFGSSGIPGSYAVTEAPSGGTDTVQSLFDYVLDPHVENLILAENTSAALKNPEFGTGNELDNLIVGNTGSNVLDGGAGNDLLVGGVFRSAEEFFVFETGSDILIGGAGDDVLMADGGNVVFTMDGVGGAWLFLEGGSEFREDVSRNADELFIGGPGNDTYILHSQQQTVVELANEGTDTIRSTADYILGDQVENLTLLENPVSFLPGPLAGTGNDLHNVLIGNSEGNVLSGMAGDDTLWGGSGLYRDSETIRSGDDALAGGIGHDTYFFNLGDGIDTIDDTVAIGEGNRIQFGSGITQANLTFTQDQVSRTLTIHVGSSGIDQVVLTNFDPTGADGSLVVEAVSFADGSMEQLAVLLGGSVNHEPTIANALADQAVLEGAPFGIQLPADTFTDQEGNDTLTYSASSADGNALPTWLSFDAATRTFSGTPDDAQVGALGLRVTVTDNGHLTASDNFSLTVTNVNEAPTVANPLADQSAAEDSSFSFAIPSTTFVDEDAIHGDVLTYGATLDGGSPLPAWLSFDPMARTFSGMPGAGDAGVLQLAVAATDAEALSALDTFGLTVSGPLPQTFVGTSGEDMLSGGRGNDTIVGGTGNDVLAGGSGDDTYIFNLGDGVDSINDVSLPGEGNTLQFGNGITSSDLSLGVGSLLIHVGSHGDALHLTTFHPADVLGPRTIESFRFADGTTLSYDQLIVRGFDLTGTAGNDSMTGTNVTDQINGLAGHDTIQARAGDDVLDGGTGRDTMAGGAGHDTYIVDTPGDVVTEQAAEGLDTVQSAITYTLGVNVENLALTGTAAISGTGNALDNVIIGNSANNTLIGGAGNDRLDGGLGSDAMAGGTGDDTYVVNQTGDVVSESLNQGTDTVESRVTFRLGSNVENLILTGIADINGYGSSVRNVLIGNSGRNTLGGGSGHDAIDGGLGNDSLFGGSGNDELTGGLSNDLLSAGSGNDVLDGGEGVDALDGGSGDDQLLGGAGDDTLVGGSGADQFTGGTGNDALTGGSGNDIYHFSRGDGRDTIRDSDSFSGNQDKTLFGATVNPLDLLLSRHANDLRIMIHGSSDQMTVRNWYLGASTQIETLQAGNGEVLLNTQVDQLIQAMAAFTQQSGLTWDQAIDQRPQDVEVVLAASWQ